jgi:tetratricopeptide (TPR) repeat protein
VRARIAIERGRILASDPQRRPEAVPALTRAVREAAAAGSPFLVLDALHMLALHDSGHEEEWAFEAFDVLAGSRDPRVLRWGVALHNNLGWTKHDAGDAVAALYHFEKAVDAADRYGTAEQQHVARWSVGRALRTLDRRDEALELQRVLARARPGDPYVQAELAALTEAQPTIEA